MPRSILSATERESLLTLPDAKDEPIRPLHLQRRRRPSLHIWQRRARQIGFGFAVQLCYMRYPGIALAVNAEPDTLLLRMVADQIAAGRYLGTNTVNAPKRGANICWSCSQPTASNHLRH